MQGFTSELEMQRGKALNEKRSRNMGWEKEKYWNCPRRRKNGDKRGKLLRIRRMEISTNVLVRLRENHDQYSEKSWRFSAFFSGVRSRTKHESLYLSKMRPQRVHFRRRWCQEACSGNEPRDLRLVSDLLLREIYIFSTNIFGLALFKK